MRGFARHTLSEAACDVWPGVASGVDRVATTRPYYRSTYVFVTRADQRLKGLTLDDPRLKSLKIGVQMVGNDAMNTPPAHSLARRGLIDNVRGYMLYGDYAKPNPLASIVAAVARGEVDEALVLGASCRLFRVAVRGCAAHRACYSSARRFAMTDGLRHLDGCPARQSATMRADRGDSEQGKTNDCQLQSQSCFPDTGHRTSMVWWKSNDAVQATRADRHRG